MKTPSGNLGKSIIICLFILSIPLSGMGGSLNMKSLAIPKHVGTDIKPQRSPASLDAPIESADSPRRVGTFMSATCVDPKGRSSQLGDASYADCLENQEYDQKASLFQNHRGYKHIQMGIVIK